LKSKALAPLQPEYPKRVEGIPVGQKRRRMHFLHGAGCTSAEGGTIAGCLVQSSGGEQRAVPVCYGQGVLDCPFASFQHLPKTVQLG
jgi:hypothetical protein